jgi:DNA-binding CsgD family transcriptional regulator
MPHIDPDALSPVAARFLDCTHLTPAEYSEVIRMAQGFHCKDSAVAAKISPETVRARRKRIYRKLHVGGVADLLSGLLAASLELLAQGDRLERPASSASDVGGALGANRMGAARNVAVGIAHGSNPHPAST